MSVTIISGDCRVKLREVPDASVNCCVTSPPYFGLRDYRHSGQIGLEPTPDAYVTELVGIFREVWRVLMDDGTLWLNLGDSYANDSKWGGSSGVKHIKELHGDTGIGRTKKTTGLKPKDLIGIPWRVAFALQADGWYLRQDIIWAKPNPMPESVTDRCTKAHEYIFLLAKSERYCYDAKAIAEPSVSDHPAGNGFDGRQGGADHLPMSGGEGSKEPWQPASWKGFSFAKGKTSEHQLLRTQTDEARETKANGKWSKESDQSSGKRITNNVAKARASGGDHDSPFGDTRNKRSVWTVSTKPYKDAHFATFPKELIRPCILAGCPVGGIVLDPFGGSGTTGEVAEQEGRNSILIELNPEYVKLIEHRTAQKGLFA